MCMTAHHQVCCD